MHRDHYHRHLGPNTLHLIRKFCTLQMSNTQAALLLNDQ